VLFNDYRKFYGKSTDIEGCRYFLNDRIENDEAVVFLCRSSDGRLMGFVQLYPIFSSTRMKSLWLLNDLFVARAFRGIGVSVALIKFAKAFSKETGSCGLLLETDKTNLVANSLYRKTGFTLDNSHNYYTWSD
jgi:GNAT superfamily N-acetyltransferase